LWLEALIPGPWMTTLRSF